MNEISRCCTSASANDAKIVYTYIRDAQCNTDAVDHECSLSCVKKAYRRVISSHLIRISAAISLSKVIALGKQSQRGIKINSDVKFCGYVFANTDGYLKLIFC